MRPQARIDPEHEPVARRVQQLAPVVAVTAGFTFLVVTVLVVASHTTRLDLLLDSSSITHVPRSVRSVTKAFLHLADPEYALLVTVGLGIVVAQHTGRVQHAVRSVLALVPWLVVTVGLKHALDRELPGEGGGLGYPSGHTGAVVLLASLVLLTLVELVPAGPVRRTLAALTVSVPALMAVILLVGHFHWFTDIVGGAALAVTCVAGATWATPPLVAAVDRSVRHALGRERAGSRSA